MLKEDLKKQSSGSPCYIYDMTFYVKRFGTKESNRELKEIKESLYGLFPKPGDIDEDDVFSHWLAEYGVVGWDNVRDEEDGDPIPFSRSHCRSLFRNEEYWQSLNKALLNHCINFENYLHDQAYEDAKELKKP